MRKVVDHVSNLRGSDFAQGKWEFDNKMPAHVFNIIYYKDLDEYREAKDVIIKGVDRERKANDIFLLEMNYKTGDIIKKVKRLDKIILYRNESFREFADFFTKKRGFHNKSCTINFSDEHQYVCVVLNHTFTDGLTYYNSLIAKVIPGCYKETLSKDYINRPFINEALMIQSLIKNATLSLTTKRSFVFNEPMRTIIRYLNIDNQVITELKNELKTSFNYVCMAFVLKYIFSHSEAISLNVLVSYAFKPTEDYYNNYSFVIVSVKKDCELREMVQKINSDVEKAKFDVVGNYELTHKYGNLEKLFKNDVVDLVYSSIFINADRPFSNHLINVEPTMAAYVGVINSKVNRYTNVAISIKTKNVFLKNNDFSKPEMLNTSKYNYL